MNLQENISRIKEMMGLVKETIDVPKDSYLTMNIKNFSKYKEEVKQLFMDKLANSNGDFVSFKNSVVVGYDENKTPILAGDLQTDNRYLNYMVSMGSKKFNTLLHNIFTEYYGNNQPTPNRKNKVAGCDPTNFKIVGPLVAQDEKSLMNYWVSQ